MNRLVFDIGALYYDVVTTRLPEWRADCRKLTEHFVRDARLILDLGTGPGVSAYESTNSMPQATVLGIDISLTMLRRAMRNPDRYAGCGGRVHFAPAGPCAQSTSLPWVRGSCALRSSGPADILKGRRLLSKGVRQIASS